MPMHCPLASISYHKMTDFLKKCPCGETPMELHISDAGQGGKWATVSGACCDEWMIEFRTNYHDLDTDECMDLAIDAWNGAARDNNAKETKQ